jgi:hypothetical protein
MGSLIFDFVTPLYLGEAVVAAIVIPANRASARRPLPPWAPPGYQRPRMRTGVKATLIVTGIIGPFVLLAGWLAAFYGIMYAACDPSAGGC